MAYTQRTARVFHDGAVADKSSGLGELIVEISRTPTLETDRAFIAYFEIEETASTSPAFKLERQLNAGSWADVNASSTVVKSWQSAGNLDGDPTANTLTGSALGFVAGSVDTANGAVAAVALNNQHTEVAFCFYIPSGDVANADTVRLRCYVSSSGDLTYTETIEITVDDVHVLPGLVAIGAQSIHVESSSFVGPICDSNGSLYVFSEGSYNFGNWPAGLYPGVDVHPWKSVDGGKRWLVQPRGPSTVNDLENLALTRFDPDTVGELWVARGNASGADFDGAIFRMSDHGTPDTWDTGSTQTRPGTAAPAEHNFGMVEKSDGDLWFVLGDLVTDERIRYDYQVAGAWQGRATLSIATGVTYTGARASLGASDRMVVCYHDMTNADIYTRQVADDNTLYPTSSEQLVNTNSTTVAPDGSAGGGSDGDTDIVIIDVLCYDLTNDYHLVIWLDASDQLRSNTIKWNGSGYDVGSAPALVSSTLVDIDYPPILDTNSVTGGAMAVDTTTGTVYAFYVGQDFKLYYNSWTEAGGWGTETTLYTSSGTTDRIAYCSANVFTHSSGNGGGKVVGYVYKICDTTKATNEVEQYWWYDEVALTVEPPSGTILTWANEVHQGAA